MQLHELVKLMRSSLMQTN